MKLQNISQKNDTINKINYKDSKHDIRNNDSDEDVMEPDVQWCTTWIIER